MHQSSLASSDLSARLRLSPSLRDGFSPHRVAGMLSALLSLLLLVMVAVQFQRLPLPLLTEILPTSIAFWSIFALYYLTVPLSEWIIYRRLWALPAAGIGALLRKMVSNELLLGYLGEVQFYAWVKSRQKMDVAPFGTIKDVTILSALTGNIATLLMLAIAWPLVSSSVAGIEMRTTFLSLGIVLGTSLSILMLRQKLFTLPRRELWFITAVHATRIFAMTGSAALMWHLALPGVSFDIWLMLATLRMLVSRLPLVPNKEVVFAGLAIFLLGHDVVIAGMMTLIAAALLVTHLCVGGVFALAGLAESRKMQ